MSIKKQKDRDMIKRTFVTFGLTAIITSLVANVYYAYFSRDSIREPLEFVYYLRYIMLLAGGFLAGYFLQHAKLKQTKHERLFKGVVYALLAMALFLLIDIIRVLIDDSLSFPWGKIVFFGSPLFALIVTIITALCVELSKRNTELSKAVKILLISSFVLYQLYIIVDSIYSVSVGNATYPEAMSPLLIVGSYLITPLVITALAYLYITNKNRLDKIFYAALVGSLYSLLHLTLWDFSISLSSESSYDRTSLIIIVSSLLFTAALLLKLRLHRGK